MVKLLVSIFSFLFFTSTHAAAIPKSVQEIIARKFKCDRNLVEQEQAAINYRKNVKNIGLITSRKYDGGYDGISVLWAIHREANDSLYYEDLHRLFTERELPQKELREKMHALIRTYFPHVRQQLVFPDELRDRMKEEGLKPAKIESNGYVDNTSYVFLSEKGFLVTMDEHDLFTHLDSLFSPDYYALYERYIALIAKSFRFSGKKALKTAYTAESKKNSPIRSHYAGKPSKYLEQVWQVQNSLLGSLRSAVHENWIVTRNNGASIYGGFTFNVLMTFFGRTDFYPGNGDSLSIVSDSTFPGFILSNALSGNELFQKMLKTNPSLNKKILELQSIYNAAKAPFMHSLKIAHNRAAKTKPKNRGYAAIQFYEFLMDVIQSESPARNVLTEKYRVASFETALEAHETFLNMLQSQFPKEFKVNYF